MKTNIDCEKVIEDYSEGIYVNKSSDDITEIIFKTIDINKPQFISENFYYATADMPNNERERYFMDNYLFCCEF